jgi:hypothetical protein
MHALWLEAGGGTDAYDVDRYIGLLRQHGWAKERKPLGGILFDVIGWAAERAGIPGFDEATTEDFAAAMAPLLADELGKHGYRIHDITRRVRPAGDPLGIGRPMSPEEEQQLLIPTAATPVVIDGFEHVTPEGDRFMVPDGYTPGEKSSRCRSCDALILWCATRSQRRAPLNADGTSHFASCPDAASWRKKPGAS